MGVNDNPVNEYEVGFNDREDNECEAGFNDNEKGSKPLSTSLLLDQFQLLVAPKMSTLNCQFNFNLILVR